jgi:hypothetical protein
MARGADVEYVSYVSDLPAPNVSIDFRRHPAYDLPAYSNGDLILV